MCVCVSIRVGFAVMAVLPPKLLWCVSLRQNQKLIQSTGRRAGFVSVTLTCPSTSLGMVLYWGLIIARRNFA